MTVTLQSLIYPDSPLLPVAETANLPRIRDYLNIGIDPLSSICIITIGTGTGRYRSLMGRIDYVKWAYNIYPNNLDLYLQGFIAPPLFIMAAKSKALQPEFNVEDMIELFPNKTLFEPAIRQVAHLMRQITPQVSDGLSQTADSSYNLLRESIADVYYEAGNVASQTVFDDFLKRIFPFSTISPPI